MARKARIDAPGALHVMAMEIEQVTALDKSPQTGKA